MKSILIIILTGFIFCTAFNSPLCTDYRDAYVGNYFCKRATTSFKSDGVPTVFKDTLTIGVAKDALDSIMLVTVKTKSYQFKFKNNILYSYPVGTRQGGKFYAANSDSIRFIISIGHASSASFYGKKK